MEKLTVSMIAVMHGDSEIITDGETWEAETREELAQRLAAFLRETADELDDGVPNVGDVARRAYENGQRDERALTDMGFPATPEQKRERAAQLLREANELEGYDVQ